MKGVPAEAKPDRRELIIDAVLAVLARDGIAGVSMRAVAKEAGVSSGLAGYYFDGKTGLVQAALRRIGDQDHDLLRVGPHVAPEAAVRRVLRRVASPKYLKTDYVALRLQMWSLARVDDSYARINRDAQLRYRDGLAGLISAARPGLARAEAARRANDVVLTQNGIWLSALLGIDRAEISRAVDRSIAVALGD